MSFAAGPLARGYLFAGAARAAFPGSAPFQACGIDGEFKGI